MTSSAALILPDRRICLICNTRPKSGNDDLCDDCSWRLLTRHATIRPFTLDPIELPPSGNEANGLQAIAIRILEEDCR